MSFNLEEYMWDKQKQKENPKDNRKAGDISITPGDDNRHQKEEGDIGHISMISDTKLKGLGDQFIREYMPHRVKRSRMEKN